MAGKKKSPATHKQALPEAQEHARPAPASEPVDLTPVEQTAPSQDNGKASFPIAGIGMSAGGLEALEGFFRQTPPHSGTAFVVVQHLDPTHASILVDLVRRFTQMQVFQVEDGVRVRPDCIYIIPPNRDMALMRGILHLMEPIEPRGLRLPIDFFFRSLAEDLIENAIGIILSGNGSDGTLGLKEIRGVGGLAMVQTPETAKYDGMPRSAIATGLVDYILPPEKMSEQLVQYTRRFFARGIKHAAPVIPMETDALEKILILLRRHTKHDFSLYKRNTINRRIERRLVVNQIEQPADYLRFLRQNPLEVETLFQELLIGVTSFFRDPDAFEVLEQRAIPQIIDNSRSDQPIRIWVPGCSTGEEAYSIAILFREQMSAYDQKFEVQIFATDINERAIEKARMGVYPDSIAGDVSAERLPRFFVKDGNAYRVTKQIREMVVFAVQSVTKDPPFSRMDLISCRNLLIYLGPELQKKVIPSFHYGLVRGGFLFLGTSETLGEFDTYFHVIDRKTKLFQRTTSISVPQSALVFMPPLLMDEEVYMSTAKPEKALNIRELTEKMLLQEFTPPCVIVNEQSEILFFHGKTADFLDPTSGEASFNILRMVREDLRLPISTALRKASAQTHPIVHEHVRLQIGQTARTMRLVVKPIDRLLSSQPLYMVIFEDMPALDQVEAVDQASDVTGERDQRLQAVERELQSTREYLQTTIEELETTNEEFKSTNEELQSANEELQSTNEEMETAKEELQSVNEELVTVNSELQSKIDELVHANNDLNNLLATVEVGIVFLDDQLNIQRFNSSATQLINLILTDIGRPIGHIVSNLIYDELVHDARTVLDTLIPKEVEVQTPEGQWFSMRIRPYRTVENAIVGLVITFSEIAEQKKVQNQLSLAWNYVQNIVSTLREPLVVLDEMFQIVSANRAFYQTFQMAAETIEGRIIYEVGNRQWDIPQLRDLLERVLLENESFDDFRLEHDFASIGRRVLVLNARQMYSADGRSRLILLVFEDITGRNG